MTPAQIADELLDEDDTTHAREVFTGAAERLLANGFSSEDAIELLAEVRAAVADCYGD
jgi:hypothetical protein